MLKRIAAFLRREVVFTASLAAALLSMLLTAPGLHTLADIDTATLFMLFGLMTTVAGLRRIGLFDRLGSAMTARLRSVRALGVTLVCVCFVLAMAATNDVALITLVPFTLLLMRGARSKDVILTVVLETIAANLGSMFTPIGNPQNLYLYSSGRLSIGDFPLLTWPYALVSLAALVALCLLLPQSPVGRLDAEKKPIPRRGLMLYGAMTAVALLGVAKVLPPWALAAVVLALAAMFDREVLREVDFTLLGTFVCFFVFVSGVKGYAPVSAALEGMMASQPLLVPLAVSQVISNVPACLLLAPFTQDAGALMLGVNLGGLGTLVASLASLISYKLYAAAEGAEKGRYFKVFTVLNVALLALLLALAWLLGAL